MQVSEVGEDGLITKITDRLTAVGSTLLGPGDDAAVLRIGGGDVIASTDVAVENVHFRTAWSPAYDIGRRVAAANLADVAAMGAVPTTLLVGLACPPETDVAWVEQLTDGIRDEAADCGADVSGGDVTRDDHITVAVTALGAMRDGPPISRSGSLVGDTVAIAGRLGWAAAGLAVLRRGFRSPAVLVNAFRRPEPLYGAGPTAAALGAHAMCDISDGLVRDAGRLAYAAGVCIDLERDALPVADSLRDVGAALGADPMQWVLGGGDDHALLATFAAGVELPAPWRRIGTVVEGSHVTVDGKPADEAVEGSVTGWDHFDTAGRR